MAVEVAEKIAFPTGQRRPAMENELTLGKKKYVFMWVAKPIYESLPYFYLISGGIFLGASMYVNHSHWPTICFAAGLICLVAGIVVFLKRRDHRVTDRSVGQRQDY